MPSIAAQIKALAAGGSKVQSKTKANGKTQEVAPGVYQTPATVTSKTVQVAPIVETLARAMVITSKASRCLTGVAIDETGMVQGGVAKSSNTALLELAAEAQANGHLTPTDICDWIKEEANTVIRALTDAARYDIRVAGRLHAAAQARAMAAEISGCASNLLATARATLDAQEAAAKAADEAKRAAAKAAKQQAADRIKAGLLGASAKAAA